MFTFCNVRLSSLSLDLHSQPIIQKGRAFQNRVFLNSLNPFFDLPKTTMTTSITVNEKKSIIKIKFYYHLHLHQTILFVVVKHSFMLLKSPTEKILSKILLHCIWSFIIHVSQDGSSDLL